MEIGKYSIIEDINESQFASVFLACEKDDIEKKVIIKKMRMSGLSDMDKRISFELFSRERDALSQLNHDNIIKYIDSFELDGDFYLITEYNSELFVLDKVIQKFSEKMKFEITLSILSGVSSCHEKKIIHRDLKPSNILVSKDGVNLKIIDFGISKLKESIRHKTKTTLREFMTEKFASPEQKRRESISEESDIYSLGILIHYIFTDNELDTSKGSTKEEILNSSLPNLLKPIVIKATNNAREDRFSSVDVLKNEVENVMLKIEESEKNLEIVFSSNVTAMLFHLEKIQSNNEIIAQKFIQESLSKDKIIFRANNGQDYFIGEDIKYGFKFIENNQIVINKVWNLDNISLKNKGTLVGAKINIYPQDWRYAHSNEVSYLAYLKDKLNIQQKKSLSLLNNKKTMSNILTVWDDYLKFKKQEAYFRTNLGRYLEIDYDPNTNFIVLKLAAKYDFKEEDKIQLNSKTGKKQIVGEFYRYLDGDRIQIIASKNFNEENFSKQGQVGINNYMASRLNIRYGEAMKQLLDETSVNTNLLEVLNNPSSSKKRAEQVKISRKHNNKILDDTLEIIEDALAAEDVYLIQGPPGTGKTTLIAELISQLYDMNKSQKILFVSPSHVAVDHALKSIRKSLKHVNQKADSTIVRLGKEENIGKNSEVFQVDHHTDEWAKNVKKESLKNVSKFISTTNKYSNDDKKNISKYLDDNNIRDRETIDELIKDEHSFEKKLVSVVKDWYISLENSDQFDYEIVKNAFLICSTCSGISSYDIFNSISFDWVIIDEAARATVPELLIPLVRSRRAILVGDHRQLPPIVNVESSENIDGNTKRSLEESLFKDLYKDLDEDLKSTLDTQFRMNPAIANMINYLYYPEVNIKNFFDEKTYILSNSFKPILWVDTKNSHNKYQTKENNSFKNYEEVRKIEETLERINFTLQKEKRSMTVGIISGYEAHKNLLLEKLDIAKWKYLNVVINNVDAFQGSEKDIIIYSIVRSNSKSDLGFLKDERRLNVSLSRAKEQLVIIGDSDVANYFPLETNPFTKLFKYIVDNPMYCNIIE